MKNRSIIIVDTQMMLLNSLEAAVHYGHTSNWLINGSFERTRYTQMDTLYKNRNLKKYFNHYIKLRLIPSDNRIASLLNGIYAKIILSSLLFIIKFDCVMIGHYQKPIHRYLIRRVTKKNPDAKAILVDDGTGTMLFTHIRKEEYCNHLDKCVYTKSTKLLFSPSEHSILSPEKLEYFTIYPVIGKLDNDSLINNSYRELKTWEPLGGQYPIENSLIIVGQTLVELKILAQETYIQHIHNAIKKSRELYNVKNVIYCPHPAEIRIEEKLKDLPEINIVRNKEPFELFALGLNKNNILAGFCTSTLWNMAFLGISVPIKYIEIYDHEIICEEPMKSHMLNIYNTYKTAGITEL